MRLVWRPMALEDLDGIIDYLLEESGIGMAVEVRDEIELAAERLIDNPHMGRPGRIEETRELVLSSVPFLLPYQIAGDTIEVLRVYHMARDWPPEIEGA